MLRTGALLGAVILSAFVAHADGQTGKGRNALSAQDRSFLRHVAYGAALQLGLRRVEMKQGQLLQVRAFAQKTVESFSQAHHKLGQITSGPGIKMPSGPPQSVIALTTALAADQVERLTWSTFIRSFLRVRSPPLSSRQKSRTTPIPSW